MQFLFYRSFLLPCDHLGGHRVSKDESEWEKIAANFSGEPVHCHWHRSNCDVKQEMLGEWKYSFYVSASLCCFKITA